MLKPTASFKLSKSTKRILALGHMTTEQRNGWKRAMIDAELSAEQAQKTSGKRSRDKAE